METPKFLNDAIEEQLPEQERLRPNALEIEILRLERAINYTEDLLQTLLSSGLDENIKKEYKAIYENAIREKEDELEQVKRIYYDLHESRPLPEEFPEDQLTTLPPCHPEETTLAGKEVAMRTNFKGGANKTEVVTLKDGGGRGIFKPKNGENTNLSHYAEPGTFYKRERASFIVSEALNFNSVPITVIRKIGEEIGSLQEFVEDGLVANYVRFEEQPKPPSPNTFNSNIIKIENWVNSPEGREDFIEELKKLFIFDYIIFNPDRHGGNLLLTEGKIHAIDNGLAFGEKNLYIFGKIIFHEQTLDKFQKIQNVLTEFLKDRSKIANLRVALSPLLSQDEIEACLTRIQKITDILNQKQKTAGDIIESGELTYT